MSFHLILDETAADDVRNIIEIDENSERQLNNGK